MSQQKTKKKADLKVVILGCASIGKTSLIHRYIEGKFQDTISTIGASFSLKQWGPYNVALWDTAGEERYAGLSSFYCRGAGAAILAFDITDEDSFHFLRARFVPLLDAAEEDCLFVVVGTKIDLVSPKHPRVVEQKDGMMLAKELNKRKLEQVPYFETSSLTGQNVENVFQFIFGTCLPLGSSYIETKKKSSSIVDLEAKTNLHGGGKKGCC